MSQFEKRAHPKKTQKETSKTKLKVWRLPKIEDSKERGVPHPLAHIYR
jgi:hypothetical protein